MTQTERKILNTLLELEQSARLMASSQSQPALRLLLARLDKLASDLPADTPPELLHYLERKSYQKALAFLQKR